MPSSLQHHQQLMRRLPRRFIDRQTCEHAATWIDWSRGRQEQNPSVLVVRQTDRLTELRKIEWRRTDGNTEKKRHVRLLVPVCVEDAQTGWHLDVWEAGRPRDRNYLRLRQLTNERWMDESERLQKEQATSYANSSSQTLHLQTPFH